jgi:hypothetical protein
MCVSFHFSLVHANQLYRARMKRFLLVKKKLLALSVTGHSQFTILMAILMNSRQNSTYVSNLFMSFNNHLYFIIQHGVFNDRFQEFMELVYDGYIEGRPPHIVDPQNSCLAKLHHQDFLTMSASDIQNKMRHKQVVVTGLPFNEKMQFDAKGLRTVVGSMTAQISITGSFELIYIYFWSNNLNRCCRLLSHQPRDRLRSLCCQWPC